MNKEPLIKSKENIEETFSNHRSWFTQLNTLHFKLMILFVILIVLTTLISLVTVNVVVERYKLAQHPLDSFIKSYSPVRYINEDLQIAIRQKIDEDKAELESNIFKITAYLLILETIIAFGASYIIVDRSLSPLNKLNKTMKDINTLDLRSKIIKDNSSGEVGELIDNFNHMIDKIQTMVEKEKAFVQNISHELKTPISGVKANLESLMILNSKDKKNNETVQLAIDSINSLNSLVNDLSILSQLDRKNLMIEKVDVNEEINNVVTQIENRYRDESNRSDYISNKKNLHIDLKLTNEKIIIYGTNELFNRAIYNLVENAIKYSKSDINIVIKTHINENSNNLRIEIKDNGVGISKKNLKKVFERFYRIDESRSRKTGGSGLGLSIVKNIVESLNGNIEVKSVLNQGSTFIITIPLK